MSYRFFFDGEPRQEVPHTGGAEQLQAVVENITPGVTLRSGVQTVNSYGLTSDVVIAEGAAPFEE